MATCRVKPRLPLRGPCPVSRQIRATTGGGYIFIYSTYCIYIELYVCIYRSLVYNLSPGPAWYHFRESESSRLPSKAPMGVLT